MMALLALASPNSPTNSPGWARLHGGGRGQRGRDAIRRGVRIARDLERHQRRGAVLGALALVARLQRRLDPRHGGDARQPRDHVLDGGAVLALPAADRCGSGSAPARPRARSGTRRPSTWLAASDSPLPQSACLSVTVPAAAAERVGDRRRRRASRARRPCDALHSSGRRGRRTWSKACPEPWGQGMQLASVVGRSPVAASRRDDRCTRRDQPHTRSVDGYSAAGGCRTNGVVRPGQEHSGMAQNFIEGRREQGFLLPPDVREWLPADHLAWFVIDAVGRDGTVGVLCRVSRRW